MNSSGDDNGDGDMCVFVVLFEFVAQVYVRSARVRKATGMQLAAAMMMIWMAMVMVMCVMMWLVAKYLSPLDLCFSFHGFLHVFPRLVSVLFSFRILFDYLSFTYMFFCVHLL